MYLLFTDPNTRPRQAKRSPQQGARHAKAKCNAVKSNKAQGATQGVTFGKDWDGCISSAW